MNYETAAAFRRALEDRLRNQAVSTGAPLVRLRKMVAFDRLLARLQATEPSAWLLKGGFALQLRFGDRSRTTRDLDLLQVEPGADHWNSLREAAGIDAQDWFEFEIAMPVEIPGEDQPGGQRFAVHSRLDGRRFEDFHVDVGTGDPVVEPAEILETPDLLAFAGIDPVRVPAYPLSQQVAEKLHAYTRPFPGGQQSSRVRDLADILLIASEARLDAAKLREAIKQTFEVRATHPIPPELPLPPESWSAPFRRLNDELKLDWEDLAQAAGVARGFLDPILSDTSAGRWDPPNWRWDKG
jgi:hypothetical protein